MASYWSGKILYRIVTVLTSPVFLAIILTLVVFSFSPKFSKYSLTKVNSGISDKPDCLEYFYDFNNDGKYEKIVLFNSLQDKAAVKILTREGSLLGWWDFRGVASTDNAMIADYDRDGYPEFYFVSCQRDTILIHQLQSKGKEVYEHRYHIVGKTRLIDGLADFQVSTIDTCDLQHDHFQDVAFSINAGYSLQPRNLFVWDIHHDTLFKGPEKGVITNLTPVNLDNDPYPEFIGLSTSTKNYPDSSKIPFTDWSSWLLVLDHNLKFYFPPVENPGHKTSVDVVALKDARGVILLSLFQILKEGKPCYQLSCYDLSGKLLKTKELDNNLHPFFYRFIIPKPLLTSQFLLADASGKTFTVDWELNLRPFETNFPARINLYYQSDLDSDGKLEYVFSMPDNESYTVSREDYSFPVTAPVSFSRELPHFSVVTDKTGYPLLFLQTGDREYWFKYSINRVYQLRYLIRLGILCGLTLLIYLIRWQYSIQQGRKKLIGEKIAGLQLSLLSRHLDPHFTFNALNTISSFIYQEEKEEAYSMFTKLTTLIRYTMEHSANYDTPLKEELDFLESYLSIQQKRFSHCLDYEVIVPSEIDLQRKVPRLLLQHYAENAIKHGLRNLETPGKLSIVLDQQGKQLHITIQDNGMGRKQTSGEAGERKGTGLRTMEEIYGLYARLTGTIINQNIEDLYDAGHTPAGTKVDLFIIFS